MGINIHFINGKEISFKKKMRKFDVIEIFESSITNAYNSIFNL